MVISMGYLQDFLDNGNKAWLLLEDGTLFEGMSVGAKGTTIGEVVFTTSMTGYEGTLTDYSYYGQLVTQTFPLIGNYGINEEDFESDQSISSGYIVREWCEAPSNFRCEHTLEWFLEKYNIIGICGIDTRALTRRLREHGTMNGMITCSEIGPDKDALMEKIRAFRVRDAVKSVTIAAPKTYSPKESPRYKVALYDYGYKRNIRSSLLNRGCEVTVLPAEFPAEQAAAMGFDGIMLSNGPGDPAENGQVIENVRKLWGLDIPLFGICLGHQLMALANGAKTAKLKYGHRGSNQPVKAADLGRTFVTSQNHGYEVLADTLPAGVGTVSYVNANDGSCEGIDYSGKNAFSVQFHPEASACPTDTSYLFDRFISMMDEKKGGC